jgi:plastocyanin domain-containing protein
MNKKISTLTFSILTIFGCLFYLSFRVISGVSAQNTSQKNIIYSNFTQNTVIDNNNQQIIQLTAKNGFSPKITRAKANIFTTLKVSTDNTFDCSSVINISELSISKTLPSSGITELDLPPQNPGKTITGFCSSSLNTFLITFI